MLTVILLWFLWCWYYFGSGCKSLLAAKFFEIFFYVPVALFLLFLLAINCLVLLLYLFKSLNANTIGFVWVVKYMFCEEMWFVFWKSSKLVHWGNRIRSKATNMPIDLKTKFMNIHIEFVIHPI